MLTFAPESNALTHNPMNLNSMAKNTNTNMTTTAIPTPTKAPMVISFPVF